MEVEIDINELSTEQKLDKLPKIIFEQDHKINSLQTKLDKVNGKLTMLKLILEAEVAQETDSEGKPKYKNETVRSAESATRLQSMTEFVDLKKELDNLEFDLRSEKIKLKYFESVNNNARANMIGRRDKI